jgi:ATP-binding cassette subfamily F protein 3
VILASFSDLEKSYSAKQVLSGTSGVIKHGDRIALLGINGSGKTTLLEILARRIECDSGAVEIPNSAKRAYLSQVIEITGDEDLLDFVMAGVHSLLDIQKRLHQLHDEIASTPDNPALLRELGNLQRIFEIAGGYNIESRASELLRGLGFRDSEFRMKLAELSGGQRNRAALAKTLIASPDLLLLDEPTNHLDISGLEYLEGFFKSYPGGILFVSHDRAFIRQTATQIWELLNGRITSYSGNFEYYLVEREKRLEILTKTYVAQKEFIAKTEDFIRRNIAGQKTRQAQSRRKMLSKLERVEKPPSPSDVAAIKFSGPGRSSRIVVRSVDAAFGYDDDLILHNLDFEIERGDRIGMIGPNGSGKTTLLNLIVGDLSPITGMIDLGKGLTIGYYDQLNENLNPQSTPLATIWEIRPELNEGQIRSYLGRFLFSGDDVLRHVDTFSGGEQSRLALAKLIASSPNFLLLDEPTNHLDIQSREALERALAEFEGTILCASHDRYFLDRIAEKLFILDDGTVRINLGNYSDYKEKSLASRETTQTVVGDKKALDKELKSAIEGSVSSRRRRTNPILIKKLDTDISKIEQRIVETEELLKADESSVDWKKLTDLLSQRDSLYEELEKLYARRRELTGA